MIKKSDNEESKNISDLKKGVGEFLNTSFVQILMTLVTLYALIGDDLRLLLFPKTVDESFTNLTIVSLFLFLIELTLQTIGQQDYLGSFFFWLDLVSTLSIITDIKPVMDAMTGAGSISAEDGETDNKDKESTEKGGAGDAASLARASRGARIGTKAGRMTRVIRLIRLIRVVKLYKGVTQAQIKEEERARNVILDPNYATVDEMQLKQAQVTSVKDMMAD